MIYLFEVATERLSSSEYKATFSELSWSESVEHRLSCTESRVSSSLDAIVSDISQRNLIASFTFDVGVFTIYSRCDFLPIYSVVVGYMSRVRLGAKDLSAHVIEFRCEMDIHDSIEGNQSDSD
jgi:hypothetical protein